MESIMGIIKVEISMPEAVKTISAFRENRLKALESLSAEVKSTVTEAVNNLLQTEMSLFLGEADQSSNKRNGYKEKDYTLKGVGTIRIKVPQDRKSSFNSSIVPKNESVDPRVKEDMAVLYLAGLSTRVLALVSKRLLDLKVEKDNILSCLNLVEDRALEWLTRPLNEDYWALYIDGTNFNIQRRGSTEKEPSLVVLGVSKRHFRSILAIEPGTKDSVDCWRSVFTELKKRGLKSDQVKLGIMDGLPGLEKAFKEAFPKARTQRCWVHALKNTMAKVPKRLRVPFKELAHKIMYANSKQDALTAFSNLQIAMNTDAVRAIQCLEKDLDSLLTFYDFDREFWQALKTTNPIERVNKELKRRTKGMGTVGERTLQLVVAFVALRLEHGWSKGQTRINSTTVNNLKNAKQNDIEVTANQLFH